MSKALSLLFIVGRSIRHARSTGFLSPFLIKAGRFYRSVLLKSRIPLSIPHFIGPFGPFKLHGFFAFSDFKKWGGRHNNGFIQSVETARGKNCIIDIGAHVGLVALPLAQAAGRSARVIAIEPAAANLNFLRFHKKVNNCQNLEIYDVLLGQEDKMAVSFFEHEQCSGMNGKAYENQAGLLKTPKDQLTLDTFCRLHDLKPDLIKIDVEGAEISVLKGGEATLKKFRPIIFASVHPRHIEILGEDINELFRIADRCGYNIRTTGGAKPTHFKLEEYIFEPI